jgi:hypothetical protein
MKQILLVLFLFALVPLISAQKYFVYGFVRDEISGEALPGASVINNIQGYGTSTNNYGYFSLELEAGKHVLNFTFVGYSSFSQEIYLADDTLLQIDLSPSTTLLGDVRIVGKPGGKVHSSDMGSHLLRMKQIREMPMVAGEPDVLKSLQFLPGVQVSNEGTTNLSIRGGSFDQNLFLLDGAPVYNPSHALGFFSVFNTDAIKSVKIYKSELPAYYGGRLSSVVDIRLKEGNIKKLTGSGKVGLIASSLTIESPIVKNKSSFLVSGRYSYAGATVNTFGKLGQLARIGSLDDFRGKNEIAFYDVNAKANFILNENNRVFLSAYSGNDHFFYYAIDNQNTFDWGNYAGSLRWNKLYNSNLFSNTTAVFSRYSYSYVINENLRNFEWSAYMQEFDLKIDFDYSLNSNSHIKFGLSIEKHDYMPGRISPLTQNSIIKKSEIGTQQSVIVDAYVNNEQNIGEKLVLNYGVRYSTFSLLGEKMVYEYSPRMRITDSTFYHSGELVKFYHSFQPRVTLRYLLSPGSSLKLGGSRASQYQHLLSNSSVGMPTDIWIPSGVHIKPQSVNQASLGFYSMLYGGDFNFSVESYYRKMSDVIDFRNNADLFFNSQIETQVLAGSGKAYGVEFFLEKNTGLLTGTLGYTLSRTTRQIEGINQNRPYSPTFDKRHNLSITAFYQLSGYWSVNSVFKYTSGGFATIPEGMYFFNGAAFNYYTERNGYELPSYHRLDISFHYKSKKNKERRIETEWDFGIYNVYHRKNVFALFVKQSDNSLSRSTGQKMYLYGITPYVTMSFKF